MDKQPPAFLTATLAPQTQLDYAARTRISTAPTSASLRARYSQLPCVARSDVLHDTMSAVEFKWAELCWRSWRCTVAVACFRRTDGSGWLFQAVMEKLRKIVG